MIFVLRYGVALVGIQQDVPGASIQLNPGMSHVMQGSDMCFYLSVNDEQSAHFITPREVDESIFQRVTNHLSLQHGHASRSQAPPPRRSTSVRSEHWI